MGLRFRVWMPLAAVLIVLLSIALMFLYGVPAVRGRLSDSAQNLVFTQAAATAEAVAGARDAANLRNELRLAADSSGGEVIVVDPSGGIVASEGSVDGFEATQEMIGSAARGARMSGSSETVSVAVVPIITGGVSAGGVIFASDEPQTTAYQLFLRSGLEAAALASVLGGGLMLLLATILSRRVERLTLGAKAIEGGDLSSRIDPGFDDELADLARSFNAMAAKLQDSFVRLEEKNETLDAVVKNLGEGVLATNLEGDVMFANPTARELLGMSPERVKDIWAPQELPDPWEDYDLPRAVARCAEEGECGEARVRGRETFLRIYLERMPAFDDHKGGVLVVMQDLSEGRRLEANQQRFLANAAHELKTPITTILGASELLLTGDEDEGLRRRFLNHIHSEARRMQRLSETLLRLARTGSDGRDPEPVPVDTGRVVREAADRMEPLAERAGLSVRVGGDGGRVLADREWLEQVLLVLTNNAIQHGSEGEEVRLRAEADTVAVEDDGAGIPEEDLPYVFERFYRGRDGSGGFGLGLAICKDLVERMGGEISISSGKGAGTRVELTLPQDDPPREGGR
ncbi:MAG: ATP-binding protein [Actinomycetota bacterium]|nr:ATP-binding protein [Actinomycetota bacterium]